VHVQIGTERHAPSVPAEADRHAASPSARSANASGQPTTRRPSWSPTGSGGLAGGPDAAAERLRRSPVPGATRHRPGVTGGTDSTRGERIIGGRRAK
jgi:hypothetical protein